MNPVTLQGGGGWSVESIVSKGFGINVFWCLRFREVSGPCPTSQFSTLPYPSLLGPLSLSLSLSLSSSPSLSIYGSKLRCSSCTADCSV